jgi:transglutaminase-like putative cysteine protease
VALSVPPRVASGEQVMRELTSAVGLDVRYENADGLGLLYTAYVSTDPREAVIEPMDGEDEVGYLQVPVGHARVAELARSVAGDAPTDHQKALRIERFLKQGEYQYSLDQPDTGDRPPLEVFLFDQKRGHCEYFSSAMAIMLRTLGIPTRNVTGFVGGQYNPYGNYYALRQGDAHSWVEAYIRGRGWVTYDPTPTSRADAGPRDNLWSDLNAFIDAMRTRWMTSVVGYDLRSQVGLLHKMARWFAELRGARTEHASDARPSGGMDTATRLRVGMGIAAVLLLCALIVWGVLRLLRSAPGQRARHVSKQQAQIVRLYADLDRALAQRGHVRPPSVTPLEHAQTLEAQGFAQRAEVRAVVDGYLEARYGGRPLRAAEIAALRQAIERIRNAA